MDRGAKCLSVATDRYKYTFYETGHEQLFDLAADPHEMADIAPGQPERCAAMRGLLLRLLRETRDPYFDVLIEHGTRPQATTDVGSWSNGELNPAWVDLIRRPPSLPPHKTA